MIFQNFDQLLILLGRAIPAFANGQEGPAKSASFDLLALHASDAFCEEDAQHYNSRQNHYRQEQWPRYNSNPAVLCHFLVKPNCNARHNRPDQQVGDDAADYV